MNLYQLTKEWQELQTLLLDEELDPADLEKAYTEISEQRDLKLENCLKVIKHFDAMAQGVAYEQLRLDAHRKRIERAGEKLREYVGMCLGEGNKFQCAAGELGWRKSVAVVAESEATPIPDAYQVVKMVTTPDKKLMKADLECGASIPGWRLEKRMNLQVK